MADESPSGKVEQIPKEDVGRILGQMMVNLHRAENLVGFYEALDHKDANKTALTDILRAAIVFIHAAIEEFFRSCTILLLPYRSADEMSKIPLAGYDSAHRPEKFPLGGLLLHRHKTVDQVIKESICEHLQRTTFNSANDVASAMERCGLKIKAIQQHLPMFDAIMKRRHEIVHQTDMKHGRPGEFILKEVTADQIKHWIAFVREVLMKLYFEEVAVKFQPQSK